MADVETRTSAQPSLAATHDGPASDQSEEYSLGAGVIDNSWSGSDRYQIQHELGRGGMAVVYLAEEIGTGQLVALKVMQSKLSGTAKQRFTREFSTIASLKHENLIEVYEYGETREGPFFAMEYFPGQTAREMIGAPLKQILAAVHSLCEAIDFVHSKRIIHRDIKPGNVLARRRPDGSGFDVKLSDFGLAKFANTSSTLSRDTNFLGTVAYCAPEQILRDELDHRADLYSLGMLVYELVSGQHPYADSRGDVNALINQQVTVVPDSLRSHSDAVSIDLAKAVAGLLEKTPADRPTTTSDLRAVIAHDLGWSAESLPSAISNQVNSLVSRFVGRQSEIDEIESVVSEGLSPISAPSMTDGKPQHAVFVTGEAGMGKTSLMRRGMRKALVAGAKIYEGRCFEGNIAPFQPFCEIIRQILSELDRVKHRVQMLGEEHDPLASTCVLQTGNSSTAIDSIVENYATELLRMGPELRTWLARHVPTTANEMRRDPKYVFRALASFFLEISEVQPLCLLIEDIHWADDSTFDLFLHLIGELNSPSRLVGSDSPPRIAICLTSRSGVEYASASEFIDRVCSRGGASHIPLTRLDDTETRDLIASVLEAPSSSLHPDLVAFASQHCLGNPFFISQSIREWRESGWLAEAESCWSLSTDPNARPKASAGVRDSIRNRLGRLENNATKIVASASVLGSIVNLDLLQKLCDGVSEYDFFDGLDQLLAAGVLQEHHKSRTLRFCHDLFRETAIENLSQPRRENMHKRIGELLEQKSQAGGDVTHALLAEHFSEAGDVNRAWNYFYSAAKAAMHSQSYADARSMLRKAKSNPPGSIGRNQLFEFEMLLAKACFELGRSDESATALRDANVVADTRLQRSQVLRGEFNLTPMSDVSKESLKFSDDALRTVGERLPVTTIGKLLSIAKSNLLLLLPPSLCWSSVKTRDELAYKCELLTDVVSAAMVKDALQMLQITARVAWLSRRSKEPDTIAAAASKYLAVNASMGKLGTLRAGSFITSMDKHLIQGRSSFTNALCAGNRATHEYFVGNLAEAHKHLKDALPYLQKTRDWHYAWFLHLSRHIATLEGDAEAIVALGKQEIDAGIRVNDPLICAWGRYATADGLSRMGRLSEAMSLAQQAVEETADTLSWPIAMEEMIRVHLQESQFEKAELLCLDVIRWLHREWFVVDYTAPGYSLLAEARAGKSWVAGTGTNSKASIRKCMRAAKVARIISLSFPNMQPHTQRVAGRAASMAGQRKRAVKHFRKAIQLAESLGQLGERGRSMVDLSRLLKGREAETLRNDGLEQLARLKTVLPSIECEQLGLHQRPYGLEETLATQSAATKPDTTKTDLPPESHAKTAGLD
ncbi:MAG: protein kinase [Rubripirellula sp.]